MIEHKQIQFNSINIFLKTYCITV